MPESEWEILTTDGYKSFRGIQKTHSQKTIDIKTETSNIVCTLDHKIFTDNGPIEAKYLKIGNKVQTKFGFDIITEIIDNGYTDVYDILHVEDVHSFYANDINVSNCIILDEFAFVPANLAEDFFSSVFPTITAGNTTKLVVISTPNGLNLFYKLWMDSVNNRNTYKRVEAKWNEVPGRDESFKKQIMANFAGNKEARWSAEFEVEFLGSDNTLLSPSALSSLVYLEPTITTSDGFKIYDPPKEKHLYTICVDPSQGIDLDYHAVTVMDCTKFPYTVAAVYRNNKLSPQLLSNIISKIAKQYNNAYTLIENNDPTGDAIATSLVDELEYENLIYVSCSTQKHGQKADGGFGGRSRKGVKMSYQIKNYGCSILKDFIENKKLTVNDFDIISELSTFVKVKNSYGASEGNNDDLVMSLVVFCWLTSQPFFQEYTSTDVKKRLFEDKIKKAEDDITLFGFLEDGGMSDVDRMLEEDTRTFEQWLAEDNIPNKPKDKKMDFEW